nr:MAG TPA: hypothetical protein [Caudoviricetes sp.]
MMLNLYFVYNGHCKFFLEFWCDRLLLFSD